MLRIFKFTTYIFIFLLLSSIWVFAYTADEFQRLLTKRPTHNLTQNNPNGCKTCHGGVAYTGGDEEGLCYICHGKEIKITQKHKKAKLKRLDAQDVRSDFEKPYHHPVEKKGLHNENERYPVLDPNVPRHAECLDCHSPHYSIPELPLLAVSGVTIEGKFTNVNYGEYEVCFKCHGADANKPYNQKNKVKEFSPDNPSYHPVVAQGKNNYLPSLKKGMTYETLISCSSCHGSDEKGKRFVRGVHGSNNEYILILPYTRREETLTPRYDLCYKCHREESILGNQSFPYHREHIEGVKARNWKGTSCSTCHNSHGSVKYKFLIDFNPDYVKKDEVTQRFEFKSDGLFKGTCYLRCHNVDHSPKTYGQ